MQLSRTKPYCGTKRAWNSDGTNTGDAKSLIIIATKTIFEVAKRVLLIPTFPRIMCLEGGKKM